MFRSAFFIVAISLAGAGAAQAACPPPTPGNTADEIRANGDRLVCLQNEISAASAQSGFELRLDALEKTQQDMAIQRRLDALPAIPVFEPPVFGR
ncbi:MAG: hypothetical protein ACOH2L_16595 [Devosia sp.]